MGQKNEPCRKTVEKYFKFLCRGMDDAFVTLCFMDSVSEKPVRGYSCVHCRVSEVVGAWEDVDRVAPGCTVHVCLNETNLKGRRTENIQCVRCLCVDIDKEGGSGESVGGADASPDLVVQSSPGKFHLYWRLGQAVPLERWRNYQIGMAWKLGGDKSLSNAVSMIRVPGFWRRTKEASGGGLFLPGIVGGKEPEEWPENGIAEGKLLKVFPWLADAVKRGAAELAKERKAAGEWARKMWKERESGVKVGDTPELGRNVTLYMMLRDVVRGAVVNERRSVELDEVLRLAEQLNGKFKMPLGASEVRKTGYSAWCRGVASGEAFIEKADYLGEVREVETAGEVETAAAGETAGEVESVDMICGSCGQEKREELVAIALPSELSSHENPLSGEAIRENPSPMQEHNNAAAGDGEERKSLPVHSGNGHGGKEAAASVLKLVVKGAAGVRLENIPASFELAGDKLVDICWRDKRDAAKALASAVGTKNYNLYASWLCAKFLEIGVFRKEGVGVFVRGKSRWGGEVFYCAGMGKEEFVSLVGRVVTKIARRCVRHKICKQWIKRLPGQACVKGIGEACWGLAILSEKQERQSPGVVVFQNGVLDLDSGAFTWDELAAVKYSHAVWCKFDLEVARKWMESERSRVDRTKAEGGRRQWSEVPRLEVFLDYMGQWFPGDSEIVEVVLRWFGYSMTTDTGRNKFAFFYGPTRAGKGSICRTFCGIVGDVNYSVSDYEALGGGFKAANFMDKLLICIEEVEGTVQEHKNRMGYLKKLLGGEKVCVERKYEQPFEDKLVGKFVLQSNEAPVYQDKGHALRARMLAVGFEKSFEAEGGSIDPADRILGSGDMADALGTVAALSWWAGRRDRQRVFELGGCRALDVGREEIVAGLDVFELLGSKYCRYEKGRGTDSALCAELVDLVLEAKDIKAIFRGGKKEGLFKDAIEKLYPQVRHTHNLPSDGGKRVRGYDGLVLNEENIILDFEEVLNSTPGQFERLKRALKLGVAEFEL